MSAADTRGATPASASKKNRGGTPAMKSKSQIRLLEQKLNKRVTLAKKSGILDLSSSVDIRFDFDGVPSAVFSVFGTGEARAAEATGETSTTKPAPLKLKELWLSRNLITTVSFQIQELKHLTTLCISHNHLSVVPPEVGSLKYLRRLLLDGNKLTGLPVEIVKLSNLEEIRLSNNSFPMFPAEIVKLTKLIRVGLSGNNIESIPGSIKYLKSLIELDLDYNKLNDLPETLARLAPTLQSLGLSHNNFSSVPHCVQMLPHLVVLRLHGNRSAEFVVEDKESGIVLEDQHIPRRHDGYLELRAGHTIMTDGKEEHIVKKLEGYLEESFLQNRENADWLRRMDEVDAVKVLKARALRKEWKTENRITANNLAHRESSAMVIKNKGLGGKTVPTSGTEEEYQESSKNDTQGQKQQEEVKSVAPQAESAAVVTETKEEAKEE